MLQDEPVGVGLADNASVRVTLTTRAGAAQSFMVGTDSPVGGGTYIIDPSGDIRLTRLAISAAVRPGVDELRSRAVARFAASAVTGVGISGAARTLMLQRVESDWWVEEYGHEVDGRRAEVPTGRHRAAADGSRTAADDSGTEVVDFPDAPLDMASESSLTVDEGAVHRSDPWTRNRRCAVAVGSCHRGAAGRRVGVG